MNADQEQHQLLPLLSLSSFKQTQQQQQQQQQPKSSLARMSSGEYVNFNSLNTTTSTNIIEPSLSLSTSLSSTSLVGLTAMTISRDLPLPLMSENLIETTTSTTTLIPTMTTNTSAAETTAITTTNYETMGVMTSSFKTPLLPMPTLQDIEGVVYEQEQQQQQQPQQNQIHHHHHHQHHSHNHYQQQQQQQQTTTRGSSLESTSHIPIGILKYPTIKSPPATTKTTGTITPRNSSELNLPLSFADVVCSTSTNVPTCTSPPTTIEIDGPTATIGAVRHKYMNINTTSSADEIPANDVYAAVSTTITSITTTTKTNPIVTTSTTINASTQNLRLKSTSTTKLPERNNNNNNNNGNAVGCCFCCCFANKRNDANASSSDGKARKSKQKTQTLWSAFITNVGICALLLAYTFLGKFI